MTSSNNNIITAPGFYRQRNGERCEVKYLCYEHAIAFGIGEDASPSLWRDTDGRYCRQSNPMHNPGGYDIIAPWVEPVVWEGMLFFGQGLSDGLEFYGSTTIHGNAPNLALRIRYDSSKPKGQRLSEVPCDE